MEIKISSSGFKFNRNARLDVKCPRGHAMQVTLGEIQDGATVLCSAGESVQLKSDDFNRQLKKIEGGLNNLF